LHFFLLFLNWTFWFHSNQKSTFTLTSVRIFLFVRKAEIPSGLILFIMDHVTIYLLHKYYRLARICDARYELNPLSLHTTFFFLWSKYIENFTRFRFVWFRFVSIGFVWFRFVSFRSVFRFVWFDFVSFRFYFVSHFTGTLCGEGYFGMNCTLRCYCKNGYCNSTSGVCQENKCKKEWTGEFCNEGNVLYS
jgi:hypothetical protein